MKLSYLLSGAALACLTVSAGAETTVTPSTVGATPKLVTAAQSQDTQFSALVLNAIKTAMPEKGKYGVSREAASNLRKAVAWNEEKKELVVMPSVAKPSFCSGACYVLLMQTLKDWQNKGEGKLPPEAWKLMAVKAQADGVGIWGRANANGPGIAKLVHDLQAGINFVDPAKATPGDFLKFFWNKEIGAKEFGHMVVFLGVEMIDGEKHIVYWSANKPEGYSVKKVAASKMHNLLFTRITTPQNFSNVTRLPQKDEWLMSMVKKSYTYEEVCRKVSISGATKSLKQKTSKRK